MITTAFVFFVSNPTMSYMPLNDEKINEMLHRLIEDIVPSKNEFFKLLKTKKLTIYHGVDPTSPHLHLGHSTNYLLMRVFHQMGHRIIVVVGDFTARIGDPSGRTTERVPLAKEEVRENYKTYKEQAAKILTGDSKNNPIEVKYNSEWLSDLQFEEIVKLASHFTVQQMIARDMFQKRLKEGNPIGVHEFLYPLMQGYDSVVVEADAEIGGSDQLFNMMAGRDLVRDYLNKEKFVITTKLLINPKTKIKLMSKSEGNYIALNDLPKDMYGKVMALPDEVVRDCFNLCTELSNNKIKETMKLSEKDRKVKLAYEIVRMYYGEDLAKKNEEEFNKVFSKKEMPSDLRVVNVPIKRINIIELMTKTGLSSSRGEARRLVEQGGVNKSQDGGKTWEKISGWKNEVDISDNTILRVGKRRFMRITSN